MAPDVPAAFRPTDILRGLSNAGVRFVVIGGIAAQYLGSSVQTFDLDICYARDDVNLEALAAFLRSVNARLRGAPSDLPFRLDARTLRNGDSFTFTTDLGPFDILGTPAGGFDYETLRRNAVPFDVGGTVIQLAGIDDLVGMKKAAGRAKDLYAVELLVALREEFDRRSS